MLPLLHPAYILRGNWPLELAQVTYLRRVPSILNGSDQPIDLSKPLCKVNFNPTDADLRQWKRHLQGPVVVDIETPRGKPSLIGLLDIPREAALSLWPLEYPNHRVFAQEILSDEQVPLVFQNGYGFDIPVLESHSFSVRDYFDDTMLMMANAWPGLPKRLDFIAGLFCELPYWKHLSSVGKEEGEGK